MTSILSLNEVSKNFPGFALHNISFALEPGYIMGLIGPNGAGKSTTIKLILNMLRRDEGKITVNGLDNVEDEAEVKKQIGYVSDENLFVDEWKPEDVAKGLSMYYDTFDRDKFEQYLNTFGLPKDKVIKAYSHGMKTRLMLAAALSRETRLLLLDEPTSGLDPTVRVEVLDILQDYISDAQHSVLFSTHITTDLEKVADFITFINRGELMFSSNKDEVLSKFRIIKGRPDELTADLQQALIGLRKSSLGFEGLVKADGAPVPPATVVEVPTLEQIVVYHSTGAIQ